MNVNILLIIILPCAIGFGIFAGHFISKIKRLKEERNIISNLLEVLDGKRKNVLKIKGKEYVADRFKMKDKDGKVIIIDLKGGEIIQDGKEENGRERRHQIADSPNPRKDGPSIRKKKRNLGGLLARIRRFG